MIGWLYSGKTEDIYGTDMEDFLLIENQESITSFSYEQKLREDTKKSRAQDLRELDMSKFHGNSYIVKRRELEIGEEETEVLPKQPVKRLDNSIGYTES